MASSDKPAQGKGAKPPAPVNPPAEFSEEQIRGFVRRTLAQLDSISKVLDRILKSLAGGAK